MVKVSQSIMIIILFIFFMNVFKKTLCVAAVASLGWAQVGLTAEGNTITQAPNEKQIDIDKIPPIWYLEILGLRSQIQDTFDEDEKIKFRKRIQEIQKKLGIPVGEDDDLDFLQWLEQSK